MSTNPHYESVRTKVILACPELSVVPFPQLLTLSHILRTLAQKDNGFELNNCCGDRKHLVSITCFATGESTDWNLKTDDLDQQDPSVWGALDKMLSV